MKWGTLYSIVGVDPELVATLLCRALEEKGIRSTRTNDDGDVKVNVSWRSRVGLRQQMVWQFAPDAEGNGTTLRLDVHYSTASRCVLAALCAVTTCIWVTGFSTFLTAMGSTAPMTIDVLWQPVVAVLLMFLLTSLIISARTRESVELLDRLRSELRVRGRVLDKKLKGSRQRQAAAGLAWLAYFFVVTGLTLVFSHVGSVFVGKSSFEILLFALACTILLGLAATGITTAFLAIRRRGAEERLVLTTPALQSSIAVVLWLTGQLSFFLFAKLDQETWNRIFEATELVSLNTDPIVLDAGTKVPRAEVVYGLGQARLIVGMLFGLTALLWLLAGGFLVRSVAVANIVTKTSANLKQDLQTACARSAASGRGFLVLFRRQLVTIWVLTSLLTAAGTVSVISVGVGALWPNAPYEATAVKVVPATGHALRLLLNLGPGTAQWVSRTFWLGWVGILVAIYSGSVAHFLWCRHRTNQRLRDAARIAGLRADGAPLRDMMSSLAVRAGCQAPNVVISPDRRAYACAHALGLGRRRRQYVELSQRVLELLDHDELEAIVAHECAHHVLGHSQRHNALHLLGRVTLFGGGFVGTLENSFGYELAADRAAVSSFGASAAALRSALLKMRAASVLDHLLHKGPRTGMPFAQEGRHGYEDDLATWNQASKDTIAQRLRLWLLIYTSVGDISYWHPSIVDRIAAIDALMLQPEGGGRRGVTPAR